MAETETHAKLLSDSQVEEIEARANTASEGPWHTAKRRPALVVAADRARVADCHVGIGMAIDEAQLNSEFIAHAREDIPALCATHLHLRAENDSQAAEVSEWRAVAEKYQALVARTETDTATRMRDKCVEKVKEMAEQWRQEASKAGRMFSDKTAVATKIAAELESLTLDQVKQEKLP